MKGLLIHNTRSIEKILLSDKLISKKDLSKSPEFDWDGPDDVPLIFLGIMFEDKVTFINKSSRQLFWRSSLFFDPKLIKDFGSKKLRVKSEYKDFFTNREGKYIKPKHKIWFNTEWIHGSYNTDDLENFSVDYDADLSLNKNIDLFHDAKIISMKENNLKYNTKYNISHNNEIVIFDDTIDLSKYLLGIYIENKELYKFLKDKYPQYNIMNKKEANKFIKNYFK
jgi:hypothetical protein